MRRMSRGRGARFRGYSAVISNLNRRMPRYHPHPRCNTEISSWQPIHHNISFLTMHSTMLKALLGVLKLELVARFEIVAQNIS